MKSPRYYHLRHSPVPKRAMDAMLDEVEALSSIGLEPNAIAAIIGTTGGSVCACLRMIGERRAV